MSQPTISLCMIVRDAKKTLGDALDSARPFVDELVVVDTGSVDNTVQVAEVRMAKIYHFPWIDDFSAARNESIEKATCDWIFWMDADDILVQSTGEELRKSVMETPNCDAGFMLQMEEPLQGGQGVSRFSHCKLFPRHPEIRFKYRIHEKIIDSIEKLGFEIKTCNAIVRHANADRNPESNARRVNRNRPLIELELQDHPNDGFVLFNAGYHFLITSTELEKSIELLERSLVCLQGENTLRMDAFEMLIKAYWRAKNLERLIATCEAALKDYPDLIMFLFNLGRAKEIEGDDNAAEMNYLRALNHGQVTRTTDNTGNLIGKVVLHLGNIYRRTNCEEKMESIWLMYLGKYPQDIVIRRSLVEAYIKSQRTDEANRHIEMIPAKPEFSAIRLALSGCIAAQREDWDRAIGELTESRKMGLTEPFQLHGLSTAYMAVKKFKEAERVLLQLLEIVPGNQQAASNLDVVRKHIVK